jgi:hypothetical protein
VSYAHDAALSDDAHRDQVIEGELNDLTLKVDGVFEE